MPSVSRKQHNFMEAVAHSPSFAKKVGVPQSVGKEFAEADKGKKFRAGGNAGINLPKTHHGKSALFSKGGDMKESKTMVKKEIGFMKAKGAPKSMVKHEESEMKAMKKGGSVKASGMGKVRTAAPSRDGVAMKGKTKGTQVKMAGSSVPKGIGSKVMKKGGRVC